MSRRSVALIGKYLVLIAVAIVLAVPAPLGACCGSAVREKAEASRPAGCCHKHLTPPLASSAVESPSCCHEHSACKCVCCRAESSRTSLTGGQRGLSHETALAQTGASSFAVAPDMCAGTASEQFVALGVAAIPHRILHCSWII